MKSLINVKILLLLTIITHSSYAQLTGEWKDNNGACYKIRQIDDRIYWSMDGSPKVINVFMGYKAGNIITGTWADLPGGSLQNSGTLSLRVDNSNQMTIIGESRKYGSSILTRGTCNLSGRVWDVTVPGGYSAIWTEKSPGSNQYIGEWTLPNGENRRTELWFTIENGVMKGKRTVSSAGNYVTFNGTVVTNNGKKIISGRADGTDGPFDFTAIER